ncbi:imm11 family protein [Flavobacterium branchiicola]|uniref:Imm11 family protein n=1 Tax=Flavobacterium branchiicola TaxID=1114875 RepID=A0ABV9PBZ3_9FLAO|nr:DUF1629 domain-containing protein [Flavobacterium branchiicola]MBS7253687.1 hypothetical protein [Flavobacterium branchiicola]
MDIYRISQNYDEYKFLVYNEDNNNSHQALEFKGQLLASNYHKLDFIIFIDPKKKQDKRRIDFDASCYYTGVLLINEKNVSILTNKLNSAIEVLDVDTELPEKFYFINLLTKIDCINKDNKSNSEIMSMVRENNILFKKNNIGGSMLFRDDKLTSSYFCTNDFIRFINDNDIKGLRFEKVGVAL